MVIYYVEGLVPHPQPFRTWVDGRPDAKAGVALRLQQNPVQQQTFPSAILPRNGENAYGLIA